VPFFSEPVKRETLPFSLRFSEHIWKEHLFDDHQLILLAISGGIDSMVMATLFNECGFRFSIAHCNFQLRKEESERDEQFVRDFARKLRVPFFTTKFSTKEFALDNKISIQMAARELRYVWFESVRKSNNYAFIATAHHRDDQTETFLLNLIRGTGLAGLHGIRPKSGSVIRPMLFAGKEEISRFAAEQKISFRTDQSNNEVLYKRNKVRLQIIPAMIGENPSFHESLTNTIHLIRESENLIAQQIDHWKSKNLVFKGDTIRFNTRDISSFPAQQTLLWKLCEPYGFTENQVNNLYNSLCKTEIQSFSGKQFLLTKSRSEIIIQPIKKEDNNAVFYIQNFDGLITIDKPLNLIFKKLSFSSDTIIPTEPDVAMLDGSGIRFPLTIRPWQAGDFFYPYGQKGKKKISDFFTDQKFSIEQKKQCRLLCSDDQILWVIGHRIDHRFRITSATTTILEVILIKFAVP
jgi:tRNA(Ile)-lysidine synthase